MSYEEEIRNKIDDYLQTIYAIVGFINFYRYDDDLIGWPTDDEKVNSHDIVLILHQSRAVQVSEFYETNKGTEIEIGRPFSIVEFNRSDERMPYYFFRRALGNLSERTINEQLKYGVQIPMEKLHAIYSIIKLYDDEPPLPYLLQVIWEQVVLQKASESKQWQKLRKNQKMEVNLEVETIIEGLHKSFSFRALCDKDSERQPRIPKREWVLRACTKLVELKEAKWIDQQRTILTIFFKKYDDILTHFIKCCTDESQEDIQPKLFKDEDFE